MLVILFEDRNYGEFGDRLSPINSPSLIFRAKKRGCGNWLVLERGFFIT
jgi:hypothetical protein